MIPDTDSFSKQVGQRVCFFGGTFDPIHKAHLRIAREAQLHFALGRILFVPAGNPPHKDFDGVTPYGHRLRMVELACLGQPGFEASRLEEGAHSSYSIDTVERLRAQLASQDEIFFLIGSDAFNDIETWKRWKDLAALVTFIVAARPGSQYKVPEGARIRQLNSVALGISSSEIRRRLVEGLPTPELPDAVCAYVRQHNLYSSEEGLLLNRS
jgi:nicotinate-nucleotide adenylyltransferase